MTRDATKGGRGFRDDRLTQDPTSEIAEALSVWCQEALACARARCRRRTQRSAPYRNGPTGLRVEEDWRKNGGRTGAVLFATPGRPAREDLDVGCWKSSTVGCWKSSGGGVTGSAGSHLRRQQGELTGYFFQIRLLGCGALRERHQHIGVLPLRRLNVPESRPKWIRYEDWNRVGGGGGAATRLKFGGEKRLKSGKENRSTLGKEN